LGRHYHGANHQRNQDNFSHNSLVCNTDAAIYSITQAHYNLFISSILGYASLPNPLIFAPR
jgi:hypothetical protein